MSRRLFAALSITLLWIGTAEAGQKHKGCYAPTAGPKCCDCYQNRCIPQSEFIETACCPMPLPQYRHCAEGCDTCAHQPPSGPCTFKYWLSCLPCVK